MTCSDGDGTTAEVPIKRRKIARGSPPCLPLSALSAGGNLRLNFPLVPSDKTLYGDCRCRIVEQPFQCIEIDGFFDPSLLWRVRKQLLEGTPFTKRQSDLFSYSGTPDLADINTVAQDSSLAILRDALYSPRVISFFADALNVYINASAAPDLSSHIYAYGDFLACHDDDIQTVKDGRRIAFILYLVDREWQIDDGGALGLYSLDSRGYPAHIVHQIRPHFNRLAVFEVTASSYHEVTEVVCRNRQRLSISGWFHGPLRHRAQLRPFSHEFEHDDSLRSMLGPDWTELLDPAAHASRGATLAQGLQHTFAESGHLRLRQFLRPDVFETVLEEVAKAPSYAVGPASARRMRVLDVVDSRVMRLFRSIIFRRVLETITGLAILSHRVILREFGGGDYTLLHDHIQDPCGLDVILGLQSPRLESLEVGGTQRYVLSASAPQTGDEGELLQIPALSNELSIVVRDEHTLTYVERVSRNVGEWRRRDVEGLYLFEDT